MPRVDYAGRQVPESMPLPFTIACQALAGEFVMSNMPSIPSAFRATAALLRDQPVLLFPDHQFSFAEIDRQSDRCAAGLVAQGVRPGLLQ